MELRNTLPIFPSSRETAKISQRFDSFIGWAEPGGSAGINEYHIANYDRDTPYFIYSSKLLSDGDRVSRQWYLKHEFRTQGRRIFTRAHDNQDPQILDRSGLISDGRFLHFAKAYTNVITKYRDFRATPKLIPTALLLLEKSLRDLNKGKNDPILINAVSFECADRLLLESDLCASAKYDIGKELEILSGMLQDGYSSKSLRFSGLGFRLLDTRFTFSTAAQSARRNKAISNDLGQDKFSSKRLTTEEVAALGLAYCRSKILHGLDSHTTFMTASASLAFTTVSMRASDLFTLKRDAIYKDSEASEQYRIRIARPKIDAHQDLPIAATLGPLAHELFQVILQRSQEAHEALDFYIREFGNDFSAINRLFIPDRLKTVLSKPVLSKNEVYAIAGRVIQNNNHIQKFEMTVAYERYVEKPGDISPLYSERKYDHIRLVRIKEIKSATRKNNLGTRFPEGTDESKFINRSSAMKYLPVRARHCADLINLFKEGKCSQLYTKTEDFLTSLLHDFKSAPPPHWPFTSKDRYTKVNDALFVTLSRSANNDSNEEAICWWLPVPMDSSMVNYEISGGGNGGAIFKRLDIKLASGEYPSFSVHDGRRWHHTQALLAGASEIFLDELAGRTSGWQSDHYDLRTPREIVEQSLETFDPEADREVIGPVGDAAKRIIPVTDRKTFLYENSAPKHITDIGGCRLDWSLNPCEYYGDCTRCGHQIWLKGDRRRLPNIREKHAYSMRMIGIATEKLSNNDKSHSLQRQLAQFTDDLNRCSFILDIEADDSIPPGTLVTFSFADGVFGITDRTTKLRNRVAN